MNNNLEYDIEGLARFAISAEITEEMREILSSGFKVEGFVNALDTILNPSSPESDPYFTRMLFSSGVNRKNQFITTGKEHSERHYRAFCSYFGIHTEKAANSAKEAAENEEFVRDTLLKRIHRLERIMHNPKIRQNFVRRVYELLENYSPEAR